MTEGRMSLFRKLRAYSWDQESWFVPLAAALEGVGPAEASWQPPGGGNTIWQTLNHINYYNERLLGRLTDTPLDKPLPDNDATFGEPGSPEAVAAWKAELDRTRRIAEGLHKTLAERTDADLDQTYGSATLDEALASWIMHDSYHTGQIVLIRKQQGSWPAKRG